MPMRFLLPALLLLPLAEIAGFVIVGQKIGVAATILAVLASTIAGLFLMRRQGVSMMRGLQAAQTGNQPNGDVVGGMLHMVAGLLLVIPGFITSLLGLLLLLPVTRSFLWKSIKPDVIITRSARFYSQPRGSAKPSGKDPSIIDLDDDEFSRSGNDGPENTSGSGRSPWAGPDKRIGD